MPIGNSELEIRLSALMTRLIGQSELETRTELGASGKYRFTDGTGALQAQAFVDAAIPCNGTAIPFSGLSRTDGNSFGSLTKLKAAVFYNPSTNATAVITSSVSGVCIGTLQPGGILVWASPQAGGLTVSGASTVTSSGAGAGESVRAILALA